jgi:hypothetical protein
MNLSRRLHMVESTLDRTGRLELGAWSLELQLPASSFGAMETGTGEVELELSRPVTAPGRTAH